MRFDVHHHIVLSPEVRGRLDALSHKLDLIIERTDQMATQEQVDKLKADVEALLAAVAAIPVAPPPPAADPALDDLDARVLAATNALKPA
jgi:predicted DNA-binding protein